MAGAALKALTVGGHETEAEAPEAGDMRDQLGGQRQHGYLVLVSSI